MTSCLKKLKSKMITKYHKKQNGPTARSNEIVEFPGNKYLLQNIIIYIG